jgi:hypothetical protein
MWYALDTARPELLVQLGVNSHVSRAHGFCSEFDNGLDGVRSALLERPSVNTLMKVDSVLPRHDILESRPSLASLHTDCRQFPRTATEPDRALTFFVLFGGTYKTFDKRTERDSEGENQRTIASTPED